MPAAPRTRVAVAAAAAALAVLPFLVVEFPPITDLPQHAAQVRLFGEALADPSPYRIQWWTPYGLGYALLGAVWALAGPAHAGRLAFAIVAALWILAAHLLAARRGRPVENALLASLLVFNHTIYWGFYSFAVGWPIFALWFLLVDRTARERLRPRDAAILLVGAITLYFAHALWFAAGLAWLGLQTLLARPPWRRALARGLTVLPVVVAAVLWFPHLSAGGFGTKTIWGASALERLDPRWLVDATLGGLGGPLEPILVALVVAWIGAGLVRARLAAPPPDGGPEGEPPVTVDRDLLVLGVVLLAAAYTFPERFQHTIGFGRRWAPLAMTFLLLAVPSPLSPRRLRPALARAIPAAAFALLVVMTAAAWRAFDRSEMSGLRPALSALPPGSRVIGLDFVKWSELVKHRPFLQAFAYAQVEKGGRLNFSFAEFPPSLVVFAHREPRRWTGGLEWRAERVQPRDLRSFDHALVNARPDAHELMAELPELEPVTHEGRFRLYRVR